MNAGDPTAAGGAALGAGSALTAAAATVCCAGPAIGPLIVVMFGASGAVAIAGLRPYTPWMLLGSAAILIFSFWRTYRVPAECSVQPPGRVARLSRATLWISAAIWIASTATTLFTWFHP